MMAEDFTVLLVEDSADDVLLMQRAFRKASLINPLNVVTDGEQAIDYLAGNGQYSDRGKYPLPVLVLLDIKLPRRSGHEVLAWLKQHPGLKRVPVVMLTSSNETADINRAYDLDRKSVV